MTTFITAANQTTVDLFATISSIARGASKTVNTTVSTIDMLDNFVQEQLHRQQMETKLRMASHQDQAIKKTAVEAALFDAEIKTKLNTSELQADYLKYEAKFSAILNPTSTTTP